MRPNRTTTGKAAGRAAAGPSSRKGAGRNESAAALRRSEERLKLALEATSDGIWDWDIPTGAAVLSPRFYTMLGYEPYEFPQSYASFRDLVHPDDIERVEHRIRKYMERGGAYAIELRMRSKAGGWVWVLTRGKVVERDAQGRPVRMVGTHKDITERKLAEERVRESEERYRIAIESSPEGVAILNNHEIIYANRRLSEMFGYATPEAIIRAGIQGVVHPDDIPMLTDYANRRQQGDRSVPASYELRGIRKDGAMIFVEVGVSGVSYEGRTMSLAYVKDITGRKEAEKALREYEKLVEGSTDMIAVVGRDRRYRLANDTYLRYRGIKREDLIGRPCAEFFEPEVFEKTVKGYLDRCFNGETVQYEMKYTYPGLGTRDVLVQYAPVSGPDGIDRVAVITRDISEHKQAENALMSREQELERKSFDLQEANTALKVLLRHRDEDRSSLENAIHANVKELIFPYVDKLRTTQLSDAQATYLGIIESGLNEIISPFLQKMGAVYSRFTRTEIQVANLIRSGKSSKEIAQTLNVSLSTVVTHRNNIRNKLALRHKNLNLQGYLLSL